MMDSVLEKVAPHYWLFGFCIGLFFMTFMMMLRRSEQKSQAQEKAAATARAKAEKASALLELRRDFELVFGDDPFVEYRSIIGIHIPLDEVACRVDWILHRAALSAKYSFEEQERLRASVDVARATQDELTIAERRVHWQKDFFWSLFNLARKMGVPLRWEVTPESNRDTADVPKSRVVMETEVEAKRVYALVTARLYAYYADPEKLKPFTVPGQVVPQLA